MKPFPEDSRTGTFCRFAENAAEGKRLYDRYLAQNNIQAKSLDGYPRDDAGQRELVTEAINAIMVLAKTDEWRVNKSVSRNIGGRTGSDDRRVEEHRWTDVELELCHIIF